MAVTQGPGLVGALLVGVATAKGLAAARRLPLAPVDHLQGHVAATYLEPEPDGAAVPVPARLGRAHAAGARDRAGRVRGARAHAWTTRRARRSTRARGCSGCPTRAGPALSKLAESGDPTAFAFPTAARVAGLDFSFAGLKTALLYAVRDLGEEETARRAADLAASYEHAIVEGLMIRVERALKAEPGARLALGGGVAANARLRERAAGLGVELKIPPLALCTDNAAMIASAARWVEPLPFPDYLGLDAYATRRAAEA